MGALALFEKEWAMVIFMLDAVAIVISGLITKTKEMWVAGAIALFLAVMWFTRGMSFIWPVILGVGMIGSVIGIIIYNDRRK